MTAKSASDSKSNDSRISLVAGFLSISVTLVFVIARIYFDYRHSLKDANFSPNVTDYIVATLSGINVSLLFYAIRLWARLTETNLAANSVKNSIIHIEQASIYQTKQYAVLHTVEQFNEVAKNVSKNFLNAHYNIATAHTGRVEVDTKNLSIEFINKMWEELIHQQAKFHKQNKKIIVDVVHTDNFQYWDREDSEQSLECQFRFIQEGGEVNRIIKSKVGVNDIPDVIAGQTVKRGTCLSTNSGEASGELSDYARECKEIIRKMITRGINVHYIYSDSTPVKDFCIVRLRDVSEILDDMSMIWHINGGVIDRCDLLIEDDNNKGILDDLKRNWGALKFKSEEFGLYWEGIRSNS